MINCEHDKSQITIITFTTLHKRYNTKVQTDSQQEVRERGKTDREKFFTSAESDHLKKKIKALTFFCLT